MPNIIGGSQLHAAYTGEDLRKDPRRVLIGDKEYVIHGNGKRIYLTWEALDGESGIVDRAKAPTAVKRKIEKLLKSRKLKKNRSR